MNYIQKAPELLREAKTKKPKYIKPKNMVSSDEFATNVTAEMRDRLIKDVLSKHGNWKKATGEEKKEIVAEVADFFNDNYPQVFKKKSIPLLQRIRAKLKKSAKPVTESVDDDIIKLLDKYSAKYHNMKQWELANAIYELKENISYNYEQAEKEEDANNYWKANTYAQTASDLEDELKVAEIEQLIREEAEKEFEEIRKQTEQGADDTMNESILDGTGIRLVRTPTGLRVEKEVKENLEENAKPLSEDIDLGPIKVIRTATGLKVLEKADESFNSKDDDKEVLNEYGKYRDEIQVGDKIKIIHLKGEDSRYDGRIGIVTHIDDIGDAWGTWGGLAIIPEEDDFEILEKGVDMDEDYSGTPEERTDHIEYVDDDPTDGKFKFPANITKKNDDQCKKYDIINHTPDEKDVLDESFVSNPRIVPGFIIDEADTDFGKYDDDCYCYVTVSKDNSNLRYTNSDTFMFKFYCGGEDDLEIEWAEDTWDDPGVYPSNAGGGPLPSYNYYEVENAWLVGKPEDLPYDILEYDDFADIKTTANDVMAKFNISAQDFDTMKKYAAELAFECLSDAGYHWAVNNAEYDD